MDESGQDLRDQAGKRVSWNRFSSPPLRDAVYHALEELVIYGRLKPGEHLVEASLAKQLQVSRAPIREALQHLHREGWGISARVRARSSTNPHCRVDDVFHVRTLLEAEYAHAIPTGRLH